MMDKSLRQGALKTYATIRAPKALRSVPFLSQHNVRHQSSAPTVAQISFWKSLIPKPFRSRPKSTVDWGVPEKKKVKSKEWNPATFYIVIFLFIGSMAIQMIALKRDFATFMRRAEVRIGLLREVVEKLQRGEEVDVEKALGTGDAEKEQEWEEVLREIEHDDIFKNAKKTTRAQPAAATVPTTTETKVESASTQSTNSTKPNTGYSNFF
ncbi:hypothetical protein F5B22DRAFT_300545 [Xylaria bambusicola]|uniref:uncharacterized protein n=1 Tax=Xylaria bambusicola TaxID=326684 RepID=UPI002007A6E5|nr:uncharacterized protein F5B22DRAFT_300545 [Xylaria bambusicola]KAI0512659.1 hypothetical protein F5B22DRAFT_300545 [Xylaria bambusicola]